MSNPLEDYAERCFRFQDQFLSTESEGTHWYLGDNFSAAKDMDGCLIGSCIARAENPMFDDNHMETAVYLFARGPELPSGKFIYRLVIEGLDVVTIIQTVDSDLITFMAYGLDNDTAMEIRKSIVNMITSLRDRDVI